MALCLLHPDCCSQAPTPEWPPPPPLGERCRSSGIGPWASAVIRAGGGSPGDSRDLFSFTQPLPPSWTF